MNNYLHGLPFGPGQESASDCQCPGQSFDPVDFKIYSQEDRLPTFLLRLPPLGDNPDLTYAAECIRVLSCDGKNQIASITMEEAGVRIVKDAASYYVAYDGRPIPGLKMECGKCHRIKIMSFWSELFWITDIPQEKVTITLSNKSQLGDVPYQAPLNFQQRIIVDGEICSLDAELFQNKKTDANGNETTTFQKLTLRKKLAIYSAPDFIEQLAKSIELHDNVIFSQRAKDWIPLKGKATVESTQLDCCRYDLNITIPYRESRIAGGTCQTDSEGTLTEVDIPDDLPDSCEVDDDWVDVPDSAICLKQGEQPPNILPPITPVGTPPVGAPCPPSGQVVNLQTLAVNCSMAFENNGVKYRKKVTKTIADGNCGTTTQVEYLEPCTGTTAMHIITNMNCEGDVISAPPVGTPPVGTPPVGSPPVGTPPVGSPPVGTPPVGSPPVGTPPPVSGRTFTHIMGAIGFEPDAEHGIDNETVERIEAFHYSWGWGITHISLWVPWYHYEPTPGVYRVAAIQKVINFCNARGLGLVVTWFAMRRENDGFINSNEIVKGSGGSIYLEGVPGFGVIYGSYGSDRLNAMIYNAVRSLANTVKAYSRFYYMGQGGGHTGEFINHIIVKDGIWESGDFCDDNLSRFNTWCTTRGLATPGTPPMIQGAGIPWPHPDFNNPRGLEFARFMTYNLFKHYRNFCNAVKSVAPNIPCIALYAAADNLQLRATANAAFDFIYGVGDGTYGSEGDGVYDHIAKTRCLSVGIGTFPTKYAFVEYDPDDLSTWRYSYGTTPPYCGSNPQWAIYEQSVLKNYQQGADGVHAAMALCPAEIAGASAVYQRLFQSCFGKPVSRPAINSDNTVTCEVTTPYRASSNILDYYGVNPNVKYAKYTSTQYWGGVPPEGVGGGGTPPVGTPPVGSPPVGTPPPTNNAAIDNHLNSNLAAYQNNVLFDVKKSTQTPYSYTRGAYSRTQMLGVASLSKSITAAVLLTLVDDGLLSLNTTVGSVISNWNGTSKQNITLKQIISHTSGLKDDTASTIDGSATLAAYCDAYKDDSAFPLDFAPGTAFKYSTSSYNVAARMAELVTGLTWKQIFEARIRNKCGMGSAEYNPKGDLQPISGNPNQPNAGHGLWVSQQAYANFMGMIRDGGVYGGEQIISSANLPLMWTDQTEEKGPWGFGFIRNDSGNEPTSESARGCYAWINRSKGYCGVLFTQAENAATIGPNNSLRDLVRANF